MKIQVKKKKKKKKKKQSKNDCIKIKENVEKSINN